MSAKSNFAPTSPLLITRVLLVLVVALALLAGYYHARMNNEFRIAKRLLTKYQACQNSLTELESKPSDAPIEEKTP